MLVFNNQQRSGYEEIASYGPKFYLSIKEMDAIYRLAGWLVDIMAADLERLVAYQYISYMDDEALTRFENFLGIPNDESKTLDERKTIAKANWSSSGKMSKTKIASIVNTCVECDCSVSLEDSALVIDMVFKDNPRVYMESIRELLRKAIPAHIEVIYKGRVDTNIVFVWKNSVTIENIVHEMIFHIYRKATDQVLDGSSFLDGSLPLDTESHLFPMQLRNLLQMAHTECFGNLIGFTMDFKYNTVIEHNMSLQMRIDTSADVLVDTVNKLNVSHSEKVDCFVIVKHDVHYLDGSERLDGSRKVDAYIKKEEL